MKVTPIQCASFVNESERKAVEHLKHRLISTPGDGKWILLSNLPFSASHREQSAEIDIVAIGPPGVRVIEVKHWSTRWINRNRASVEHEADKVTDKARKIGTTLRERVRSGLGRVDGVIVVTQEASEVKGLANRKVKGVPMYTLDQWREALDADARAVLSELQVQKLAKALEPKAGVAMDGSLQRLAGYVDLSLQTSAAERFHRTYKATHASRRERVILHLYDLSALGEGAETKARREWEALRRVKRHTWAPSIRDSYQDAPGYAGEMKFFTIDDPAAPSLAQRRADASWGTGERLGFALQALQALFDLHADNSGGEPLVHRSLSPETILVGLDNLPILTGFDWAKIPGEATVATVGPGSEASGAFLAPEVRTLGLAGADQRSDVYQLCASLAQLFSGQTDEPSRDALRVLSDGTAEVPRDRAGLRPLIRRFRNLRGEQTSQPAPPPARFWTAGQVVQFRDNDYKVVEKLGQGGIGIAYKVEKLDPQSQESLGHYVAKVVLEAQSREVLKSYRRVHAHLHHSALSTIFEVAREWQENSILALLTWIEGEPLSDYLGKLSLVAEERSMQGTEACLLHWLRELCTALDKLHGKGLVHGDVSPSNLILTDNLVVLTDYDLVTQLGEVASSHGVSLYCSPSREEKRPVNRSDDFYSLAASFYHAIFGEKPFQYGGNLSKDRGLNWDGIACTEFPVVRQFLDRATAPSAAQRYRSTSEVLSDLEARGDPPIRHGRGKEYTVRHHVRRTDTRSEQWYRDAAEQGDAEAQHVLGGSYHHGNGVEQDFTQAAEWYRRAAEQGHQRAQYSLGGLYLFGRGVAQDEAEAANWYRKAAERGDPEAQYELGKLYHIGKRVGQDYAEAAGWYRAAAESGQADAQFLLGEFHQEGRGVAQDEAAANGWYQKAAESYLEAANQGKTDAQYSLCYLYLRGNGVPQDFSKAEEWCRKAAAQEYPEAQRALGWMWLDGIGRSQDLSEAEYWYRRAAQQGDVAALNELRFVRSIDLAR